MTDDPELWRRLKVGDHIRIVHLPDEFARVGYQIHRDTLSAYRRVIERRRPLRVYEIDDWGLPWVHFRLRRKNGRWEFHYLAVNHDGLVKVKRRPRRKAI